jgi:uncharacterized protein (TIGR02391 family)
MKSQDSTRLLLDQIKKVEFLLGTCDRDKFKAWHKQSELLLKSLLGVDSDEVKEFRDLSGYSSVTSNDQDRNRRLNQQAYVRDLHAGKSILSGVLEFIKSTSESKNLDDDVITAGTLDALHPKIKEKCSGLYLGDNYAEAVEKSFKIVRDKLRGLTTYETGSEAFGRGRLYIKGAAATNVDDDFQNGVKFLTMAIDRFRNEKSHTADGKIENPVRAYEYLALSSLAMHFLDDTEVKQDMETSNTKKNDTTKQVLKRQDRVKLDPLQILALRAYAAMDGYKEFLISPTLAGNMIYALGDLKDKEINAALNSADPQELEANIDEMANWGLLTIRYNKSGNPIYKLAKPGYDIIKQNPELRSDSE